MNPRSLLLELFDAALRAVDGRACVARALAGAVLPGRIAVFAIGKAASAMTRGAQEALGPRISRALVVTKPGHLDPGLGSISRLTVMEAAHPLPDERSLAAGAALARALTDLPADEFPLFLVSGGSSSLVEQLVPGVSLAALQELNARGLAAGWDIATLNRERARLSRLKGGGVAALLRGRPALALFLSDVPGDDPAVIGSGLLGQGQGSDAVGRRIVGCVEDAVLAAQAAAHSAGLELARVPGRFSGDAAVVAHDFVTRLRECAVDGLVWGGESTVMLPHAPGRGGRNTHLALIAARALRAGENLTLLAAGTDGTDGPTEDAGAIVDAGSIARATLAGVDVERALAACDSGTLLEWAGDLVNTGPTGTNVGDLLIGIRRATGAARGERAARVL